MSSILYRNTRILNDQYSETTTKNMDQTISNIITYIYRYYPDEITSRDISRRMHGNYNYINRNLRNTLEGRS